MADVTNERKSKVEKAVEKASPSVKEKVMKDFGRISFRDDSDFETYLAETQAYVDFKAESNPGVNPSVQAWIDAKDPNGTDYLGGKDINGPLSGAGSSSAGSLSGKSI